MPFQSSRAFGRIQGEVFDNSCFNDAWKQVEVYLLEILSKIESIYNVSSVFTAKDTVQQDKSSRILSFRQDKNTVKLSKGIASLE